MTTKELGLLRLFWKFYSALFVAISLNSSLQILDKNSVWGVYYNTTIVFNDWYIIPYFLNILNTLIECIVCLFIFGYAFDVQALSRMPPWLFYVRLLSNCTGHTYQFKMIQASFSQGKIWGLIGLASLILPVLPSYIAQWRMTFKKN